MLLCDGCDEGWHRACLDPPLLAMPVGGWFCQGVARMYRTYSRLPSLRRSPCSYCRIEHDLLATACQTVLILVGGTIFTERTVALRYVKDDVAGMGGVTCYYHFPVQQPGCCMDCGTV
jgi:hypothetical protein